MRGRLPRKSSQGLLSPSSVGRSGRRSAYLKPSTETPVGGVPRVYSTLSVCGAWGTECCTDLTRGLQTGVVVLPAAGAGDMGGRRSRGPFLGGPHPSDENRGLDEDPDSDRESARRARRVMVGFSSVLFWCVRGSVDVWRASFEPPTPGGCHSSLPLR